MELAEINAGTLYLRQLRADGAIDDRPALVEAFADPVIRNFVRNYVVDSVEAAEEYVRRRAEEWKRDQRCSWAVAEPTTGELLGEVGLKELDLAAGTAEVAVWVHPSARGRGVATTAVGAAVRFGFGALGLSHIDYVHEPDNAASREVARKSGFTLLGPDGENVRWRQTAENG